MNNDIEWVKFSEFESPLEYLKCFQFLTDVEKLYILTKRTNDILIPLDMGYAYCASISRYIPLDNKNSQYQKYCEWIVQTCISKDWNNGVGSPIENSIFWHYKMLTPTEEQFSPIPKYLVELWKASRVEYIKKELVRFIDDWPYNKP
jgi:hypothetical protein